MGQDTHTPVKSHVLTSSATLSDDGRELIVKVVNLHPGEVRTSIRLQDVYVQGLETITMSSLHLRAENAADNPYNIVPRSSVVPDASSEMEYTFEPLSFTILRYKLLD